MRNDKHLAAKLRRKGKSYKFISKELNIPKSTLSDWFRDEFWSKKIKANLEEKAKWISRKRLKLIIASRSKMWREWRESHRKEASKEFLKLRNSPLFVSGVMLYWSEGDNNIKNGNTRLTNTDPRMMKIFINFAQKICKVPKENIKISLILYPDLNDGVSKKFWSNYLNIPETQFNKTQYIQGSHPTKRLENGICMARIGGTGIKEKIHTWVNLFSNDLMRE